MMSYLIRGEWECIILSKFNGKDLQGQALLLLYHQREMGIHNWNLDGITAYFHQAGAWHLGP